MLTEGFEVLWNCDNNFELGKLELIDHIFASFMLLLIVHGGCIAIILDQLVYKTLALLC